MCGAFGRIFARSVASILLCLTTLTALGERYHIEAIGPATDAPDVYVQYVDGLNNHGDVAFTYSRSAQITPTLYTSVETSYVVSGGSIIAVPNLGFGDARPNDLTDAGLIVGGVAVSETYQTNFGEENYYEPFVSQDGKSLVIHTPSPGLSYAVAANENGVVVGSNWSQENNKTTVFTWTASGGYRSLGDFDADTVYPTDINERNDTLINVTSKQILQFGDDYQYNGTKTILDNNGTITQVPDSAFGITRGAAVNDSGVVVGSFGSVPGREDHAFIWDATNGFRDLGQTGEYSTAIDINNAGVVIGASDLEYGRPTIPWVYTDESGRQPLFGLIDNPEGWTSLEYVSRINDRGQIVGVGYGPGGQRVFLATPVPEPSTVLLFISCTVIGCTPLRARY